MTALQKSVQTNSSFTEVGYVPTFQETYSTSYSHGLESIYKLETIDLKSVRKLNQDKSTEKTKEEHPQEEWEESQGSFDLGPLFRGWMTPCILLEPIQVLGLSKPIEKNLLDKGLKTLSALQEIDLRALGLGHGHVGDVERALREYLHQKPLQKSLFIDFLSLLKCLVADLDPKKVYSFLAPQGLADWLVLSNADRMDIKKITKVTCDEWKKEILEELKSPAKTAFLTQQFNLISGTWLKPFMMQRSSLATKEELLEAVMLRSFDESISERFLKVPFFQEAFLRSLPECEGVFGISSASLRRYQIGIDCASSYFPRLGICYRLDELFPLIASELAFSFIKVTEEELYRYFDLCPFFDLFRDEAGRWCATQDLRGFGRGIGPSASP